MNAAGLVLINYQIDHFSGGKAYIDGAESAARNAAEALLCFRDHQRPFIHIQKVERVDLNKPFATGTEGIRFHAQVPHFENEPILFHFTDSTFNIGRELTPFIERERIETLAICFLGSVRELTQTFHSLSTLHVACLLLEDASQTFPKLSSFELPNIKKLTVEELLTRSRSKNS